MKHRYGSRFPIALDIKVKKMGLMPKSYHTLDIGIGGALIDANHNDLMKGHYVQAEIEINKTNGHPGITFISKALVIYTGDEGVGLCWSCEDEACFLPLYEIIHSKQPRLHSLPKVPPQISP